MSGAAGGFEFCIFKAGQGYGFLVSGKNGVKRSGLPRRSKKTARRLIHNEFPDAVESKNLLPELVLALQAFFRGEDVKLRAKLDMSGLPPFTTAVYRTLKRIRRGRVVTYKELAELSGSPRAARGVGAVMRRNPFPPLVPCHRVLGSNGQLTGFSSEGGVDMKRHMLLAEGIDSKLMK